MTFGQRICQPDPVQHSLASLKRDHRYLCHVASKSLIACSGQLRMPPRTRALPLPSVGALARKAAELQATAVELAGDNEAMRASLSEALETYRAAAGR